MHVDRIAQILRYNKVLIVNLVAQWLALRAVTRATRTRTTDMTNHTKYVMI